MALKTVRKVSTGSDVLAGLQTSRYEKAGIAFGVIPGASYAIGDTLIFDGVNSQKIIDAKIIVHTSPAVTLDIDPGTVLTSAKTLAASTHADVSYVINYIRGTGQVGVGAHQGDLLKVTITQL